MSRPFRWAFLTEAVAAASCSSTASAHESVAILSPETESPLGLTLQPPGGRRLCAGAAGRGGALRVHHRKDSGRDAAAARRTFRKPLDPPGPPFSPHPLLVSNAPLAGRARMRDYRKKSMHFSMRLLEGDPLFFLDVAAAPPAVAMSSRGSGGLHLRPPARLLCKEDPEPLLAAAEPPLPPPMVSAIMGVHKEVVGWHAIATILEQGCLFLQATIWEDLNSEHPRDGWEGRLEFTCVGNYRQFR